MSTFLTSRHIADAITGQIGKKVVWQYSRKYRKYVVYPYPKYPPNNSLPQRINKFYFEQCVHQWRIEPESIKQYYKKKAENKPTTYIAIYISEKIKSIRTDFFPIYTQTLLRHNWLL